MKYLSRLMALLCVMGLMACGAAADTLPLDVTADDYSLMLENQQVSQIAEVVTDSTVTFDLAKGPVVINGSEFSGYNSAGTKITGSHSADKKYIVTSSSQTSNTITLNGNGLVCDLTLKGVNRPETGKGLNIGGAKGTPYSNQNVTLRLEGTNTIGQLFYIGNNKLKITSTSGDGSTNGSLKVKASEGWSAAIGGDDDPEHFTGLTIAGGTISATATNGAAIGGGGNGNVEITITGGKVTATNSGWSAAIGGGGGQSGGGGNGTITISGGTVTAKNTGSGVAIGGGSSESNQAAGTAVVNLTGGNITATASNRYAISGGYPSTKTYASTTVKIGKDVTYSGKINPNATYVGNEFVFDLAKSSVVFNGNSFTGKDMSENTISGTHSSTYKYFVRQSGSGATSNKILLNDTITGQVNIEIDGINVSAVDSIYIPALAKEEKHVVLYLKGENRINNLLYYTGNENGTGGSVKAVQSKSTLEITSYNGNGSTEGKLTAIPSPGSGNEDGSVHYNAVIGGTDSIPGVAGLTISGGTLVVKADESNDCSAIGGGGNGYAGITITGGHITAENASTGATIGGGVGYTANGSGCDIVITGGTVIATNHGKYKQEYIKDKNGKKVKAWCYGVAIGGGSTYMKDADADTTNVTISGGRVTATVPEGQTAIGAGNSNASNAGSATVTVKGGTVDCTGGIGGGSSTEGNGGAATLNVTNGHLTVKGFIGGGATKNGTKGGTATVNISGASTVVKAASIGGGVAETKNVASKANVTITNGDVQAQIVMEGDGSTFDMSGGTIDNSNAAEEGFTFKMPNGGAVYVAKGTATMTGGTITSCSTTGFGGAVYVTGGSFTLSGDGVITNCSASKGGAAYVNAGSFTMSGGEISECTAEDGGGAYVTGGSFTITGGTMTQNSATQNGGAAYATGGAVTIGTQGSANNATPVLNNNHAVNGGAIYVDGQTPIMHCGTISNNYATGNGGAVYVSGGGFTMHNGDVSGNGLNGTAVTTQNGGAVYVTGGQFTFGGGEITGNKATTNGGAVYVTGTGAKFTMENGTMTGNSATLGGASYVNGGNFEMTTGTLSSNAANSGGAVYVSGGNFIMRSGKMELNTAVTSDNKGYGGAVFTDGGNIEIGIENCTQDNPVDKHKNGNSWGTDHPLVTNNKANFGGALGLRGGIVKIYCCDMHYNESDNPGTGENIFMDEVPQGTDSNLYHFWNGANIGETTDHGIVSIGGKLYLQNGENVTYLVMEYNSNYGKVPSIDVIWKGETPGDYSLNLPYCPSEWRAEMTGYSFVGWTSEPLGSDASAVRNKSQYVPTGTAIYMDQQKAKPFVDENGNTCYKISYFAVWAPATNAITYAYSLNGQDGDAQAYGTYEPDTYTCQQANYSIVIPAFDMPGYTFRGWRLEASPNTKSNWNSDSPNYSIYLLDKKNGVDRAGNSWTYEGTTLTIDSQTNFGDIQMVAIFEPAFAGLKIVVMDGTDAKLSTLDTNESYVFQIVGDADDGESDRTMLVSVIPNEDGYGSTTIYNLPVGKYTVTELGDWSWRYTSTGTFDNSKDEEIKLPDGIQLYTRSIAHDVNDQSVTEVNLDSLTEGKTVTFTVERTNAYWLDDNDNRSYPN